MSTITMRADLADRLDALAMLFSERAYEGVPAQEVHKDPLRTYLLDHAASLVEFAQQCRDEYERVHGFSEPVPTAAQGVALARFLRRAFNDDVHFADRSAHVSRGGAGLPDTYLYVRLADGYEGGIDVEGRVST